MNPYRRGTALVTVALFALIASIGATAFADTYYVATNGNDKNPGTLALPWRTIQKACNTVSAGSTVQIRAGRYHEKVQVNVSGSAAGGWIVIENYPNEAVTVDGANLHAKQEINNIGSDNIFLIQDEDYIQISGLEIVNNSTVGDPANTDGSAIRVYGGGDHIAITGNTIHHTRGSDSMGITVYGTEAKRPVSNLTIDNNLIYDCTPAHSETLTMNGNVDGFEVAGNVIHNVNNIGIDCIGGDTSVGPHGASNATRNGTVHNNIVSYVHSSYDGAAAGIYVDGGQNIDLADNIVFRCDEGIEVGAEIKPTIASGIVVRDNLLYYNTTVGLVFGGYNANGTGSVTDCQFLNNTLYHNDTTNQGNGELQIQYHATNCLIENNLFYATSQNLLISWDPGATSSTGIISNYNLFYCPGGPTQAQFHWANKPYATWATFIAHSGEDQDSLFANPLFVNTASAHLDLHLQTTSPAINMGDPNFEPAPGEVDVFGGPRLLGGRVDIGAQEVR
jgi:hypothetical protein